MREEFRADLQLVSQLLVDMAEAVRAAMREATRALLSADRTRPRTVIARDAEIDALYRQVEERVADLLARQAPVASDLRTLITALHVAADLERMGDLADHVAKTALRRHPSPAVPAELRPVFTEMADVADRMAAKIADVLAKLDAVGAAELDARRRRDGRAAPGAVRGDARPTTGRTAPRPRSTAPCSGRFYERYADHAVNAGDHVVYLVTGEHGTATTTERAPGRRPTAFDGSAALVGDRRGGLLRRLGVEVGAADGDRPQRLVEVVAQRDAGRDVELGDRLVGDAVEVLDQGAQRVAVRGRPAPSGRRAGPARSRRTSTAASAAATSLRHSVRGISSGGRVA